MWSSSNYSRDAPILNDRAVGLTQLSGLLVSFKNHSETTYSGLLDLQFSSKLLVILFIFLLKTIDDSVSSYSLTPFYRPFLRNIFVSFSGFDTLLVYRYNYVCYCVLSAS